jgi:PLP dependent protein
MALPALGQIERRIETACTSVGRATEEVTLIAVTKTVSIEQIREAYDAGLRHFGESRLQEALPKIEALPKDIHWHFIGKLQSNKVRKAAALFDVIHTIESESQLKELGKLDLGGQASRAGRLGEGFRKGVPDLHPLAPSSFTNQNEEGEPRDLHPLAPSFHDKPGSPTVTNQTEEGERRKLDLLVEVNIAEELQKAGVFPHDTPAFVENVLKYEQANFRGLMTIGPANRNREDQRPFFRRLRELNEKVGGTWLSMGMSSDFDVAIQEGATHIRVGSALFGARN